MFTRIGYLYAIFAALGFTSAQAEEPFHWPNGARAAIGLAYDDDAPSQLDNAIPVLNRQGLRGTLYLSLACPHCRLAWRNGVPPPNRAMSWPTTHCSTNTPAARRSGPGYRRTAI